MDEAARLRIIIQAQGVREAQRAMRALDGDLHRAARTATRSSGQIEQSAHRSAAALSRLGRAGAVGGTAAIAVGFGAAIKAGFKFNAQMESNELAMRRFVGSTKQTRLYLADLFKLAKQTPFEFTDLTAAARRMMAFGLSAKQTKETLSSLGDALAAQGAGRKEIEAVTRAFGQVQAKGKVYAEELIQFTEAGIPAFKILQKELGLTDKQMKDIGKTGIPAEKAIAALTQGMTKKFAGAAREQSKTWDGMMSTLRDKWAQSTGAMTKGLFTEAKKWLPTVGRTLDQVGKIFDTKLTAGEKLRLSAGVIDRNIVTPLRESVGRMKLGEKLSAAFERAAPKVLDTMGNLAGKAAGAFVTAFKGAGPLGKIFTLAFLGHKLGVFRALGRRAADAFAGGLGGLGGGGGGGGGRGRGRVGGILAGRGATPANPVFVSLVGKGAIPGTPVPGAPDGTTKSPKGGPKTSPRFGGGRGGGIAGLATILGLELFGDKIPKGAQNILFGPDMNTVTAQLRAKYGKGPGAFATPSPGHADGPFGGPNRGTSLATILGRFPQLSDKIPGAGKSRDLRLRRNQNQRLRARADTIQFNLDMEKITAGVAADQLEALASMVKGNKRLRRALLTNAHSLRQQAAADARQAAEEARQAAEDARQLTLDMIDARGEFRKAGTNNPLAQNRIDQHTARQRMRFAKGPLERLRGKTDLRGLRRDAQSLKVEGKQDDIEFALGMGRITSDVAGNRLKNLAKMVKGNKALKRSLLLAARTLLRQDKGSSGGFELNVGNVRVPTVYEVRRHGARRAAAEAPRITGSKAQPTTTVQGGVHIVINGAKSPKETAQEVAAVFDHTRKTHGRAVKRAQARARKR